VLLTIPVAKKARIVRIEGIERRYLRSRSCDRRSLRTWAVVCGVLTVGAESRGGREDLIVEADVGHVHRRQR